MVMTKLKKFRPTSVQCHTKQCEFVSTEAAFLHRISHIERCDRWPQKLWWHYLNKIPTKHCFSKIAFSKLSSWRC